MIVKVYIYEGVEILLWFYNVLELPVEVGLRMGKGLLSWGKWSKKVGGIDDWGGWEGLEGEGGVEGGEVKEKEVNLLPHQHPSPPWTLYCWLKV